MGVAKLPDGGYQLEDCLAYGSGVMYDKLTRDVACADLVPVARAFADNMRHVSAIPMMLTDAVVSATITQRAVGLCPIWTGNPGDDLSNLHKPSSAQELAELRRSYMARMAEIEKSLLENVRGERWAKFWQVGTHVMEREIPGQIDRAASIGGIAPLAEGAEAMVLNSYVAFESLATDVWIAALNQDPDRYMKFKGGGEKTVSLKRLKEFDEDLRGRYGEFFVRSDVVGFLSIEKIRDNYRGSFGDGSPALTALYKYGYELERAEQVRHLIAHKAGRVDPRFALKAKEKNWTDFTNVPIGEYLPLTGPLVAALIDPCVKTAVDLIHAVDGEMAPNAPTNP